MKIQGTKVTTQNNYLNPVTFIPNHANGNVCHHDCKQGVILEIRETNVLVLYCKTRTAQSTMPDNLVFG